MAEGSFENNRGNTANDTCNGHGSPYDRHDNSDLSSSEQRARFNSEEALKVDTSTDGGDGNISGLEIGRSM